jgi:hypothetical protein
VDSRSRATSKLTRGGRQSVEPVVLDTIMQIKHTAEMGWVKKRRFLGKKLWRRIWAAAI